MALTTRLPSASAVPFHGFVETTGDALRLVEAARRGLIPRITRRLNDLERRAMIRSGSVFIFSNEESGIKRWTEGLSWSASRIVGNFLVYREVSDRGVGRSGTRDSDRPVSRRRVNFDHLSSAEQADKKFERSLVGCLADGRGRFKASGLIKKTITIKIDGSDHHLIAYYNQDDVRLGRLKSPVSRPDIMALGVPPELLESTKFRIPPVTEIGPDGRPIYICDADELDSSMNRNPSLSPTDGSSSIQYSECPGIPLSESQLASTPNMLAVVTSSPTEVQHYTHTPIISNISSSTDSFGYVGEPSDQRWFPVSTLPTEGQHLSDGRSNCSQMEGSLFFDSFDACKQSGLFATPSQDSTQGVSHGSTWPLDDPVTHSRHMYQSLDQYPTSIAHQHSSPTYSKSTSYCSPSYSLHPVQYGIPPFFECLVPQMPQTQGTNVTVAELAEFYQPLTHARGVTGSHDLYPLPFATYQADYCT